MEFILIKKQAEMASHTTPKSKPRGDLRKMCRAKWGKDWHNVHPVIKKCRLAWASGRVDLDNAVTVRESGGTYVV